MLVSISYTFVGIPNEMGFMFAKSSLFHFIGFPLRIYNSSAVAEMQYRIVFILAQSYRKEVLAGG